jgi:dTDP-4-dehydrorhamnose reductase
MRILVTGAQGMLGQDLVPHLSELGSVDAVDIDAFDITDSDACRVNLEKRRPDIVVHAAAYTQVDKCESHRECAMKVNGEGAGNIARACSEIHAKMVYYSTDYVFNGRSETPYLETDTPDPLSVYGESKLEGENQVTSALPLSHLILRTSWLFGIHGRNFIETIIALARERSEIQVVDDQIASPTFTMDLAQATRSLLKNNAYGIVNTTNTGITSWFGFAEYFLNKTVPSAIVHPIPTESYPLPARRPAYSALSTEKYGRITGAPLPHWKDATNRYLRLKHPLQTQQEKVT